LEPPGQSRLGSHQESVKRTKDKGDGKEAFQPQTSGEDCRRGTVERSGDMLNGW